MFLQHNILSIMPKVIIGQFWPSSTFVSIFKMVITDFCLNKRCWVKCQLMKDMGCTTQKDSHVSYSFIIKESTDHRYRREIPDVGSNRGIRVFSCDQITVIPHVRILPTSTVLCPKSMAHETSMCMCTKDHTRILFCICFRTCGQQGPIYPQLELYGWRHHYT